MPACLRAFEQLQGRQAFADARLRSFAARVRVHAELCPLVSATMLTVADAGDAGAAVPPPALLEVLRDAQHIHDEFRRLQPDRDRRALWSCVESSWNQAAGLFVNLADLPLRTIFTLCRIARNQTHHHRGIPYRADCVRRELAGQMIEALLATHEITPTEQGLHLRRLPGCTSLEAFGRPLDLPLAPQRAPILAGGFAVLNWGYDQVDGPHGDMAQITFYS